MDIENGQYLLEKVDWLGFRVDQSGSLSISGKHMLL
jgi:hypothetical protein